MNLKSRLGYPTKFGSTVFKKTEVFKNQKYFYVWATNTLVFKNSFSCFVKSTEMFGWLFCCSFWVFRGVLLIWTLSARYAGDWTKMEPIPSFTAKMLELCGEEWDWNKSEWEMVRGQIHYSAVLSSRLHRPATTTSQTNSPASSTRLSPSPHQPARSASHLHLTGQLPPRSSSVFLLQSSPPSGTAAP